MAGFNRETLRQVLQYADIFIALAIVSIIVIIIIPIPAFLLDLLLVLSITFALVVFLLTMFTTETLQFSVFPTLLLVVTLFRLSLNVSSTRLILRDAVAGDVINAFGNFVVGGNYVVGFVVFIIITVIQFVVITNGAGRVAEVGARFTLDAMPGKQMSIDADYTSGLIDEDTARNRRKTLQQEADFYGSMDGASKFVKGDAIAGIIIVLINLLGGLAIGVIQQGLPIEEAVQIYAILTIGDGLVSQIPALLISTASGILVTRSANERSLGDDLSTQLLGFPKVIGIASGVILMLAFVPNLPFWPFFILAAGAGYAAFLLQTEEKQRQTQDVADEAKKAVESSQQPEDFLPLVSIELLELELGYNLLSLTEKKEGGDLLERVTAARRQFALDMGLVLQPIRMRDNLQLTPYGYAIKLKGNVIGSGEVRTGHFLAMDPGGVEQEMEGIPTKEPAFGLDALWVSAEKKDQAEMAGYTVVDAATVLITHLTELIKNNAHELLGRQEVKILVDMVKENNSAVVEELIPNSMSIGEVQKILQNLLLERVPVRDMVTILETLADHVTRSKDLDYLTEMVRQSLSRTICSQYVGDENRLFVLTLDSELEKVVANSLQQSPQGAYPAIKPDQTQKILKSLSTHVENMVVKGQNPLILVSPRIRLPFRRLLERGFSQVSVMSFNEVLPGIDVQVIGVVKG